MNNTEIQQDRSIKRPSIKRVRFCCHTCGKNTTRFEKDLIEQLFTGRRFCSDECWEKHLKSEGLSG